MAVANKRRLNRDSLVARRASYEVTDFFSVVFLKSCDSSFKVSLSQDINNTCTVSCAIGVDNIRASFDHVVSQRLNLTSEVISEAINTDLLEIVFMEQLHSLRDVDDTTVTVEASSESSASQTNGTRIGVAEDRIESCIDIVIANELDGLPRVAGQVFLHTPLREHHTLLRIIDDSGTELNA